MSDQFDSKPLLLPSLSIAGFRGIDNLKINRLGRVTLLAGCNGVGKTTVLDAIRIYADRGHVASLVAMLRRSEEVVQSNEDTTVAESLDFEALFHGRAPVLNSSFAMGPNEEGVPKVCVEVAAVEEGDQLPLPMSRRGMMSSDVPVLKVTFDQSERRWPVFDGEFDMRRVDWHGSRARPGPRRDSGIKTITCHSLGPGLPGNQELDRLWSEIALTPSEPLALDALRLASNFGIDGVAVVSGVGGSNRRRVVVKLESGHRVPLRSLGDGATRLFGVAVALASSADGFLLIDEAENGLHHELQSEFWEMVLRAADKHNVQVVATTHSWDCIVGFSVAARRNDSAEGVVVRLERDGDDMRAREYSEEEVEVAAAMGIEVR